MIDEETFVEHEEHWVSVSDLMAGLMMVFLLIAIIFMINVEIEQKKIKNVVILYDHLRTDLYNDLLAEFKPDLESWGAEISPDLSVGFYREELLFDRGEYVLTDEFKSILDEFFPRYLAIITSDKYQDDIAEVRIEGHTSSGWWQKNDDEAYILNMNLSQARTRTTLAYVLSLQQVTNKKSWIKKHMTANGLSSSKLIYDNNGQEDELKSRRVEFRLRTDAEAQLATILKDNL